MITEAMWQRMPWHPKARIIAQLEREATLAKQRLRQLTPEQEIDQTLDAAREHLATTGPDPEGPARLTLLVREVKAASKARRNQ